MTNHKMISRLLQIAAEIEARNEKGGMEMAAELKAIAHALADLEVK